MNKKINEKIKQDQVLEGAITFDSAIDGIRELNINLDNLIKSGKLKESEKKVWEKRLQDVREILRIEVDDRTNSVITDTISKRDEEWREIIKNNYVEKKVVIELENTNQAKDLEIRNQKGIIQKQDNLLSEKQSEIFQVKESHQFEKQDLNNYLRNLEQENNFLRGENWKLNDIIENRLDADVRQWQEQIYHDQEVLDDKEKKFYMYAKAKQSKLEESLFEVNRKLKDVERREKLLAEKENKIRKREDEFDKRMNHLMDIHEERTQTLTKREQNVILTEKSLLRLKDELDKKFKKIQDDLTYISKEKEMIKKAAEHQKNNEQRFKETFNRADVFKKDSTPHTIFRNNKQADVTDQRTNKQHKSVTLHPVLSNGETASTKLKI